MIFQATQESQALVKLPSELVAAGADKTLTRVRAAGKVVPDSIQYSTEPVIVLKFKIHNPGKLTEDPLKLPSIPVVYNGIKPDMFQAGRDVIVDGEFVNGVFQASKLLTQCPSKYEPPSVQ